MIKVSVADELLLVFVKTSTRNRYPIYPKDGFLGLISIELRLSIIWVMSSVEVISVPFPWVPSNIWMETTSVLSISSSFLGELNQIMNERRHKSRRNKRTNQIRFIWNFILPWPVGADLTPSLLIRQVRIRSMWAIPPATMWNLMFLISWLKTRLIERTEVP